VVGSCWCAAATAAAAAAAFNPVWPTGGHKLLLQV